MEFTRWFLLSFHHAVVALQPSSSIDQRYAVGQYVRVPKQCFRDPGDTNMSDTVGLVTEETPSHLQLFIQRKSSKPGERIYEFLNCKISLCSPFSDKPSYVDISTNAKTTYKFGIAMEKKQGKTIVYLQDFSLVEIPNEKCDECEYDRIAKCARVLPLPQPQYVVTTRESKAGLHPGVVVKIYRKKEYDIYLHNGLVVTLTKEFFDQYLPGESMYKRLLFKMYRAQQNRADDFSVKIGVAQQRRLLEQLVQAKITEQTQAEEKLKAEAERIRRKKEEAERVKREKGEHQHQQPHGSRILQSNMRLHDINIASLARQVAAIMDSELKKPSTELHIRHDLDERQLLVDLAMQIIQNNDEIAVEPDDVPGVSMLIVGYIAGTV